MFAEQNGAAPADSLDRLGHLTRQLARRRLTTDERAELDVVLARLEAISTGGSTGGDDGYLVTDGHGVIVEVNATAAALLQSRPEFLLGKPFPLYLAERHWPGIYGLLNQVRHASGTVQDWRVALRQAKHRQEATLALTMLPVTEADHTIRLRWLLRDVSRGAWAERALGAERAFADSLLDTAQVLALVLDSRGYVLRANTFARHVTGLEDRDLIGQEWTAALLPKEERAAARETFQRATQRGEPRTYTSGLVCRDMPARAVAWSVKAVERPEGRGPYVLVLGHDVTELQQAQRRALEAERLAAIGQVMATMAHESRNLLQVASACLERLSWRLEGQTEALDLIERAQQAHRGLTLLFEDVRLYAAPLRLNLQECRLPDLWRETFEAVRLAYPGRQAQLLEEVQGDATCRADRFRLGQVFRNLMDNSFSACAGCVLLTVACQEVAQDGRPALRVAVRDNGPGLDEEQRRRLCEPFFTTKENGTGLGTAIAKRIIDAHGGRIAAGDPPSGTEILIWLPKG